MGNLLTYNMAENFKKNQEFIQSMNKIKIERQIQLQYQMQERMAAMEMARNRDLCLWFTTFSITATVGFFTGFRRTKKTYFLIPILPLVFGSLYLWDLGYGNKLHRIRMEAEHIMAHEAELLEWPCGVPSASQIDLGRIDAEDKKKIHPPLV